MNFRFSEIFNSYRELRVNQQIFKENLIPITEEIKIGVYNKKRYGILGEGLRPFYKVLDTGNTLNHLHSFSENLVKNLVKEGGVSLDVASMGVRKAIIMGLHEKLGKPEKGGLAWGKLKEGPYVVVDNKVAQNGVVDCLERKLSESGSLYKYFQDLASKSDPYDKTYSYINSDQAVLCFFEFVTLEKVLETQKIKSWFGEPFLITRGQRSDFILYFPQNKTVLLEVKSKILPNFKADLEDPKYIKVLDALDNGVILKKGERNHLYYLMANRNFQEEGIENLSIVKLNEKIIETKIEELD